MDSLVIGIVANEQEFDNKSYEAIVRNNLKYLDGKCSYIGLIMYDNTSLSIQKWTLTITR